MWAPRNQEGGAPMQLMELLRKTYCPPPPETVKPFVDHFRRKFGRELAAIVFYGSKLHEKLASETSFYDFYLICDDYERFFTRRRDRWLARLLPPNIYYLELPVREGGKASCKYCVISLKDLQDAVSPQAKDLYHLGRFSKRIAVVWARGDQEREAVLAVCLQAMRTLVPHALARVGLEFTLEQLVLAALGLSYEGEVRLEPTEQKAEALYRSAEPFYRTIWPALLAEYSERSGEALNSRMEVGGRWKYFLERHSDEDRAGPTERLIEQSRRRARARWPKNIILVDNWVDILLAKVERTYGVKLELTPRERKWALILGWKHYFRLRREGKIR
jgi:hypothetical protein